MSIGRYRENRTPFSEGPSVHLGTSYNRFIWISPEWVYPMEYYGANWPLLYDRAETCQDQLNPGPPYRTGGPFYLTRYRHTPTLSRAVDIVDPLGSNRYKGRFQVIPQASSSLPTCGYLDTADLSSYGPTGWNKFKPGKPTADLAVFLGELKDFKGMLKMSIKELKNIKGISNWHLAIQFGWRPLLNDLRKFYKTFKSADDALDRLRKYNGRFERRGGTVARESETVEVGTPCDFRPALVSSFYEGYVPTPCYPRMTREFRVWFKAAFRFWIPDMGTKDWKNRAMRTLYGFHVTPAVVWELVPWSWLVDWCTNLGDVLSNLDDGLAENLHAAYAYVMREQKLTLELHQSQSYKTDKGVVRVDHPVLQEWVVKERCVANPFSLGWTLDDMLSLRQLSILAALGVQRFC